MKVIASNEPIYYPVWHYTGDQRPNELGISRHSYRRHHLPTGEKTWGHVWLRKLDDLYKLLNYWNSQSDTWKYYV